MGALRFLTHRRDLWSDLDDFKRSGGWDETDKEAKAFIAEVREEIKRKDEGGVDASGLTYGNAVDVSLMGMKQGVSAPRGMTFHETIDDGGNSSGMVGHHEHEQRSPATAAEPFPSFHRSHIYQTSTPRHVNNTSTIPNVPTPSNVAAPALPSPLRNTMTSSKTSPRRKGRQATPDNIPSPVDTPGSSRLSRSTGEGRGRRDDPATPIPLGIAAYSNMRGKKDFLTLTKHFEVFAKTVAKQDANESMPMKGKGRGRAVQKVPSILGGKVFAGLRFCIPPELGQVTKHKQRWDIVRHTGKRKAYDLLRSRN